MAKLKVYRTAIGFHDAYVAAPSQKVALAAWGSDKNLFARGAAEVVTDPKLTAAPLAHPGEVVRLSRGSLAQQLKALGPSQRRTRAGQTAPAPPAEAPPRRKRKPPSRAALEKAEAALAANEAAAARELEDFRRRERALAEERKRLAERHYQAAKRLEARLEDVRERYRAAYAAWAEED